MKPENLKIGIGVKRIASDYTNGRTGTIEEINGTRARVRWMYEKNGTYVHSFHGEPGRGVRTWVNCKYLQPLI